MNGFVKAMRWPSLGGRKVELDFLRGIAILLACGWHFNQTLTGIAPLDWLLTPGRKIGWAGVDLFFVLSGFLIGGLLFSEYENEGGFRPGRFLIRRAFKIWPVLYSFILLQLLIRQHPWQSYFFQCLFHVQNYFPTPLSQLWSLAVEEQFYLAFAILYAAVLAFAGNIRPMPWLLAGLMVLVLLARR
ncbi:acyltransferase [Novosphingobium sp. BL-8H]|uniref:acyltransferase family protein n=1 Tax=Novosphingobium sp. BL-8H TaxID=3127640 RepID=UPI00375763D8